VEEKEGIPPVQQRYFCYPWNCRNMKVCV
jgi:hypothetical protein